MTIFRAVFNKNIEEIAASPVPSMLHLCQQYLVFGAFRYWDFQPLTIVVIWFLLRK